MIKVITYGTFDLFHVGHVNLLRRARSLGDYLVVALSTDEFNAGKHKHSFFSYEERKAIVESCRYVDLVIPETDWEQKIRDVSEYHIDKFVMGDDWKGKFDFLRDYCEVIYLPRTPNISSTGIKQGIHAVVSDSKASLAVCLLTLFPVFELFIRGCWYPFFKGQRMAARRLSWRSLCIPNI